MVRVASRWLLPAAGAFAAVLLSAGAAHATVDSPIGYTGPPNPTTADTLSWTVASTPLGDALSCDLLLDGQPVATGSDCSNGTYSHAAPTAGAYVLAVTDTTDQTGPVDSDPITVNDPPPPPLPPPGQPTPSAPTPSTDSNTKPTWTLGLPAGSNDGSCTVYDNLNNPVVGPTTCSGTTWTSDLGAGATSGDYTLNVVANGDNVTTSGQSAPGTAVYSLDLIPPGALTVTPPAASGSDNQPTFTITEASPQAASFTCTLTLPDLSTIALTTGCGVGTLTPTLSDGNGKYTLTVVADDGLGNTTTGSADYTLNAPPPGTPTVSRPTPSGNTTSPSFSVGNIDPGATVTCAVSGAATVTSCSATAVAISITGGEGDYTVSVTAKDAAGNTATGSFTYTLDTTPPSVFTITRAKATDSNPQPSFAVNETDNDPSYVYSCTVNGGTSLVSQCGPTTSLDLRSAGDGTYDLVVTITDAAGNSRSASFTYVLDTAAPTTPTVSRSNRFGNTSSPSFSVGSIDPGVTVTCAVSPGASVVAGSCSATGVTISISGGEGDYTVSVTATDAAGNTSTGTFTYTYDVTPPSQPTVSRTPALDKTRTPSFTIGNIDADASVSCSVSTGATIVAGSCTATGVSISISGVDGDYVVSVTATDAAGNSSTRTFTYTLDTIAPTTPTVSRANRFGNTPSPSFSVGNIDPGVTVTCDVSAGATVTACSATGVSISISGGEGDYTVSVTAKDAAGNTATGTFTYTYDVTPPTQPTVSRSNRFGNTSSPSFGVSTVDGDATVTCGVSAGATVTACSATGVSISISGGEGDYTVSVTAKDPAGNTSTGTFTYTYDITPPSQPTLSRTPALDKTRTPSFTIGNIDADASVSCSVSIGATIVAGSCTATGVSISISGVDGDYTVSVTATDPAGNTSTRTFTYTLDTTPPTKPVIGRTKSLDHDPTPSFTVTEPDADATVTCTVSTGATVTGCSSTGVSISITGGDGNYVVTVTAADPLGNAISTTYTYTLDTIPPTQPTVSRARAVDNTRTPSFVVGHIDSDSSVTCSVSGSATVSACSVTGVTINISGADGDYLVSVTATDPAGNTSTGTFTYTLDTTPPPAPSVSVPPALTKLTSVSLSISDGEPGAVITCVLTAPGGATVLSGSCPGAFDTTGYADGTYTLVVTATDPAGNTSSTTVSWVRDTTPPPAPSVSAPTSPSKVTAPAFTVSDAETGVTYTCTVTGPSVVTASCGATTTLNLVGALDGTYTVSVTATDAAGNVSAVGSATYLLDTTAPTAPIVSTAPSPSQGRHVSFSVTGVESGGTVTCTLIAPAGSTVSIPQNCGSGISLDLTGQPDGGYTLSVTVTDAAGNISVAGSTSYLLDTTPPSPPVVTSPASPGNDRTPTLTISAEAGARLTCTVDRYFQQVWSGSCPADGTFDLTGYEDGEFEITIIATDAAGNVSAETTVIYLLDTAPPAAPVLTEPASPSPIEKPVWIFTQEDGTTATCTITGPNGQVVQGPQQCSSPFTGLLKGLPDGTYTLTIVITDAAGNDSVAVHSVFILDRQAPVPPTVVPPKSPGSSRSPAWQITVPKGATLTCTLLRGGTIIDGPGACPAGGVYSLAGMPDGTYTLKVTSTDSAGNVSATSVSTYVLDTARPTTPHLDYSAPSPSLSVKPYWGFTLPSGTTGRCELLRDGNVLATKSDCKGAVSFDLTGRSAGTYTVRIIAVDAAGNQSHALVASYVLGIATGPGGSPSTGTDGTGGTGIVSPPVTAHHHRPGGQPATSPSTVQQVLQRANALAGDVGTAAKKVVVTAKRVASSILPDFHDKVTEHVSKAVQGVVNAVSHAGGGTGFPLLLLLVVLGFLVVQNRIDRRDPKLALASVAADDTIEFRPPPSRGNQ